MDNQKLYNKLLKEIEEVKNKRLENFQNQVAKDFRKIKKKYIRLFNFKEAKE